MKYSNRCRFFILPALVIAAGMLFAACEQSAAPPEMPSIDENVRNMVLNYLRNEHAYDSAAYFAADEPDAPKENDLRIDSMAFAGEAPLYEGIGVAYEVECSRYHFYMKDADDEGGYTWNVGQPCYVILKRYDDSPDSVLGISYSGGTDKKIEDAIVEVAYGLMDIEVSLKLDGSSRPVGPLSSPDFINEEPEKEILKEYDPIYNEGDYWLRLRYKHLTADCYYSAQEDTVRINSIETTRTDAATYRGLRVNMTREAVLSAYPAIYDSQYLGYEGDYLWYCSNDEGLGAALLFWFQGDVVTKIQLINMFD